MKILSEAFSLKSNKIILFFITKDEDFCEFSEEIKNEFGINVVPVQEPASYRRELEKRSR
jgi:hypothetical protein